MQQVCNIFLQFLAYSFLGWTCETIYCSIGQGKFVNRGFLNGPLCPVYGFGAMAVLVFLRPIQNNIPLLFLCGMLVTSVIEYITGYLLEKLFATKWWDYSTYRFNIHGRVCLRNSLMFGVLSVVAARVVDPVVRGAIVSLPFWASVSMSAVLLVILLVDLVLTVRTILDINSVLRQFHQLVEQAKLDTAEYLRQSHQELQQRFDQYQLNAELGRMELMDYIEQVKAERAERRAEKREELLEKLESGQKGVLQHGVQNQRAFCQEPLSPQTIAGCLPEYALHPVRNRLGPLEGRGQAEKEQQKIRTALTAFLVWERLFYF